MGSRESVRLRPTLGAGGIKCWRILAVIAFAIALVATHWPRLVFGPEAPSDKLLHASTFGVLTFLLWRTRWIRSGLIVGIAMIAYSAFDEATQMLPWVHRHTSIDDWIADLVGVVCATLLIVRPSRPKSAVARMRCDLDDAADREMFGRPFTWAALAVAAALGVLVGVPATVAISTTLLLDQRPWHTAFLGGMFFCAVGIAWSWRSAIRAAVGRLTRAHACFGCGATIESGGGDSEGSCASCATKWRFAQWVRPAVVDDRGTEVCRRASIVGALRGGTIALVTLGGVGVLVVLMSRYRASTGDLRLPTPDMRDLFSYAFAVAAVAIVVRSILAANFRVRELEGVQCVACAHDLRGIATTRSVGICPECGREFARVGS